MVLILRLFLAEMRKAISARTRSISASSASESEEKDFLIKLSWRTVAKDRSLALFFLSLYFLLTILL